MGMVRVRTKARINGARSISEINEITFAAFPDDWELIGDDDKPLQGREAEQAAHPDGNPADLY